MTSVEPHFPRELVDLVLDELVTEEEILASISLVARWWRHRANPYRFSNITFRSSLGGEDNASKSVKSLKTLLDADAAVWSPDERIAPYFSYVSCPIEKTNWRKRGLYETSACIQDGSMEKMLRAIFKPDDQSNLVAKERTLELRSTYEGSGRFPFDDLDPTLKDTIYDICSNNSISHLSLYLFESIPIIMLLSCSTVATLTLDEITTIVPDSSGPIKNSCMHSVTKIAIRNSPSFLELVINSPSSTLCALTEVELTLDLYWFNNFKLFTKFVQSPIATKLTMLSVVVENGTDVMVPPLKFSTLDALETLEIECHMEFVFPPVYYHLAAKKPILFTMSNLLLQSPPPNINLLIGMSAPYDRTIPNASTEIAELFHRRIHHGALLPALERFIDLHGVRVDINVELEFLDNARHEPDFSTIQGGYEAVIKDEFADFTRLPGVTLTIDIPDA